MIKSILTKVVQYITISGGKIYMIYEQFLKHLTKKNYSKNIAEFIKLLSPAGKILDVGCEDGSLSEKILEHTGNNDLIGIDIVPKSAKKASMRGISVVLGDANKGFPFRDYSFDAVISNQVIEHVCDTDLFVKECYRTLKKGGYCIVSTVNLSSLHNIISLILAYQPPLTRVSDQVTLGNPLDPMYKREQIDKNPAHRRIFVAKSLRELFEYHGFVIEELIGTVIYPLSYISIFVPKSIMRRYGVHITIKARKV